MRYEVPNKSECSQSPITSYHNDGLNIGNDGMIKLLFVKVENHIYTLRIHHLHISNNEYFLYYVIITLFKKNLLYYI